VTGKEEVVVVDSEGLPKSVSGYNINNNISYSGSNYSFTSGVSAVSSESSSSRKCSLTRDFSFSSLSNFQNVNLLDKSQIPRSKSAGFGSRRVRRSRSPSPQGANRSKSVEGVTPIIKIERTPSDDSIFSPSPTSPPAPLSPRSPTSPTSVEAERLYSSRGTSRLSVSTPLSPIKESRKETESLLDFSNSPIKEKKIKLAPVPQKQSSRLRCAQKIVSQLERGQDRDNNNTQDSYNTMDLNNQDQDKLNWPPAKASNVKQSKSVTFKDC